MPRVRFGHVHLYNNLFTASGNAWCTMSGFDARLLVENNEYKGVNNPLSFTTGNNGGEILARGNLFDGTTGSRSDTGNGFTPPYSYTLDATANLMTTLSAKTGPQ
jgi:pectate lyase